MVSVICSILPAPRLLLASLLLMMVALSTGCGLKGDLYLPEETAETRDPAATTSDIEDTEDDDAARS